MPTLVYLPKTVFKDAAFLRSFFNNFNQLKGKTLLLHDSPTSRPNELAFLTKRIGAFLSENLTTNNSFSASQRNLISLTAIEKGELLNIRGDLMLELLENVDCLVLNTLVATEYGETQLPAADILLPLLQTIEAEHALLFPENPLSAVAASPNRIETTADREKNLALFPEEAASIEMAFKLRPATLVSASNFFQARL